MSFTYLLINLFTILVPLTRSFEERLAFYKKWKYFLPATLITACFFISWDIIKTAYGVWGFNNSYILGPRLFYLPLEEYLFFITVPYACLFIYETLSLFYKPVRAGRVFTGLIRIVALILIVSSGLFWGKAYTFSVMLIAGLIVLAASYIVSAWVMQKILITYLISLVPMLAVNGLLTGLPVVIYNNHQNLGIRIGSIPVEDFIYNAALLYMNIALYEYFKHKYPAAKP